MKKLNNKNLEETPALAVYAETLKALAHPIRLKIVCGLSKKESCNVGTMSQNLDAPQPTVSQHLNILKNAGIIKGYRSGTHICYKIISDRAIKIIKSLDIDFCKEKLV